MGCGDSKSAPTLQKGPSKPKYKVLIVGCRTAGDTDKDKHGNRFDSTPIANGVVTYGMSCDLLNYDPATHDEFVTKAMDYDGIIVRINPGQLDGGAGAMGAYAKPGGAQKRFNDAMDQLAIKGKAIWSSPVVQQRMGAKDALVRIKDLNCGLPDTFAYYDKKSFDEGFKKSCAFSPRVVKQNKGTSGEGIWLVWLESKRYCETFGEKSLTDRDRLKLMEMSDNHVEYHTVKEFVEFCVNGPGGDAGNLWATSFPGKYLEGGKAGGGQIVDQRLLPRIVEGEVRMQMVKDELHSIIHKKPKGANGEMSAVASLAEYTYYAPNDPKWELLRKQFEKEVPAIMSALDIGGEPLPILWTADFIPVDNHVAPYVIGEFNCACVSLNKFAAAAGADLKAVGSADMAEGYKLAKLMGKKVLEQLDEIKSGGGFTSVGRSSGKPAGKASGFKPAPPMKGDIGRESTPLPARN